MPTEGSWVESPYWVGRLGRLGIFVSCFLVLVFVRLSHWPGFPARMCRSVIDVVVRGPGGHKIGHR